MLELSSSGGRACSFGGCIGVATSGSLMGVSGVVTGELGGVLLWYFSYRK